MNFFVLYKIVGSDPNTALDYSIGRSRPVGATGGMYKK